MPATITVYTIAELKESFPDAYAKVHERWRERVGRDSDCPWSEETMDSLRAVVKACGGKLTKWSIGPGSYSDCTVEGIDDDSQGKAWYLHNVLKPNGYTKANGHAYFPGNCAFTGYCADDDFLKSVWKSLCSGETLTKALEGLADDAREMMENDVEQMQEEESMVANWDHLQFTEDGTEV
jgi:hypothetical protein